jgi:hypothetical protein
VSVVRYTYAISADALRFFAACELADQEVLLNEFRALAMEPHREGDLVITSLAGRAEQVAQRGRFLINYWADHGAKEVRITALGWS